MDGFSFSDNSTGYSPPSSWGLTDTPSTTPTYGDQNSSIPGYNYGDSAGSSDSSSYNPWYQQQDMASAEQALGPDGQFGMEALQGNMYEQGQQGPTHNDVDYDALDWLKGNYKKYQNYIDPALRVAGIFNPAIAIAGGLKDLFMSPQGAVAGRVGGAFGQALGGAALGPAGAILGGQLGGGLASGYANEQSRTTSPVQQAALAQAGQGGSRDYSLLASGLLGLSAARDYRKQADNLQSLYGQNSPYAQQLRQQLQRTDASKGRRSQAGTREVELQARLADVNSRNAPQLEQLTTNNRLAQLSALRDVSYFAKQGGGLGSLFGSGNNGGQAPRYDFTYGE